MNNLPTQSEQGMVPIVRRDRKRAQKILDEIKDGSTTKMAAEAGGVARRTLYEWIYKAEEIRDARMEDPMVSITPYDDDYIWFLKEYEQAKFSRKKKLLKRIEDAGETKWQANAWLLQNYDPEDFGKQGSQDNGQREQGVFTFQIATKPRHIREKEAEQVEDAEYEIVDSSDNG